MNQQTKEQTSQQVYYIVCTRTTITDSKGMLLYISISHNTKTRINGTSRFSSLPKYSILTCEIVTFPLTSGNYTS